MNEYFYTFLIPQTISQGGKEYFVYGYREVDDKIVCFSATTDLKTPWTKAEVYTDSNLLEALVALLPEKPTKRRKRKAK